MGHEAIVLLALVTGALAGPVAYEAVRDCAKQCNSGGIKKFNYREGRTYIYDYEISTKTGLQSPGSDSSNFLLKSSVEIGRITACEFVLRMKNVRVEGESRSKQDEIKEELERKPLRFAYDDGRIDHICPSEDDNKWTLNMKRGVLSAFQNSMESLEGNSNVEETDISGRCRSEYTISKQGGWFKDLTIIKTKNLRACQNRNSNRTSISSTPYWIQSDFQNLPVMDSEHTCEHVIKDNLIKKIICHETHIFKPFSKEKSGAVTKANLKMEFVKEEAERSSLDYIAKRSTLLFDHSYDNDIEENREEKVMKILEDICVETKEDVTEKTPQLFLNLVREMRSCDLDALQRIDKRLYNACPSNEEKISKFFKDALPMCNTPASVEFMINKIKSKDVVDLEAKAWVLSFNLIQHVQKRMLVAAKELLDMDRSSASNILSVSALVRNYVRHDSRLLKEPEVISIIESLEKNLGYKCKSKNDDEEEKKMIFSLKALGNIGEDRSIIHQCYKEVDNELAVRLAAIEALRLVKSSAEKVLPLMEILENNEETAEIRIAAYLIAIDSADRRIIERVKNVLEIDPVTQVSSFIWTHLTNIQESSAPCQKQLQDIIEEVIRDEKLSRRFDMDSRKFSRFIEKSIFSHGLNVGGHVSGKIVFDDSYVPRSASADLSVDLFGSHINLLGMGVRVKNLEHPIESLFGPQGYFPQNTVHDVLKSVRKKSEKNQKNAADKNNRIELFHERFGVKQGEPEGSAYFRLFDNDILFGRFSGMEDLKSAQEKLNAFDILIELSKEKDIDYSKNIIFLESSHISPCLGGLPIKLSVNGTASVNMKISGKADIRKLFTSPHSCHIEGKIQPSAAIQISAMMGIDSYTHQNGIKIKSVFSTSFVVDGKLAVRDGEIFESHLNVPRDKMEILKVSSEVFVVDKHLEKPQRHLEHKRFSKKFCRNIADVLELCFEGSLVNSFSQSGMPQFPLAGPASLELSIEKKDPKLNQIRLDGKWVSPKGLKSGDKYAHDISLSLSTPQTSVQRELRMDLKITRDKNGFLANLRSPSKKILIEGSLVDEPDLKRAKMSINIDDKREYSAMAEIQIDKKTYSIIYRPSIEINIPDRKSISLAGAVLYVNGKKLNVDFTLKELSQTPINFKGDFEKKFNGDASTNISLNSYMLSFTAKGFMFKVKNAYSSQIDAQYRIPSSNKQYRLSINAKLNNQSTESLSNYKTTFELRSNQYPEYNTWVKWDYQHAAKHLENRIELRYGQDSTDNNKLDISQILSRYEGLSGAVKITYPKNNIDFNLNLKHQISPSSVNTNIQVQYAKNRNAGIKLLINNLQKSPIRGELDLQVFYIEKDIRVKGKVEEYSNSQYKAEGTIQYQKSKAIKVSIDFKNKNSQHKINHELSASLIPESGLEHSISYVLNSRDGDIILSAYLEQAKKRIYGIESDNSYQKDRMFKTKSLLLIDGQLSSVEASYIIKDDRKRNQEVLFRLDSANNKIYGSMSLNFRGDKFYDPADTHLKLDLNGDKIEFISKSEAVFVREDQKVQLEANLITPYTQLRNLKISSKYTNNGKIYNALLSSIWNNDKKLELSLNGEYKSRPFEIVGKMQLDSPYIERLLIELKHEFQNKELKSLVRYSYGSKINKKLEISGKFVNDDIRDIRALVRLAEDGSRDPEYLLSLKHIGDNKREETEAQLIKQKDKYIFKNSFDKRIKNSYSGQVNIDISNAKFVEIEGKYNIEISSNKLINKVDMSWGRNDDERIQYEIELSKDDYRKIQGKIFALAPIILDDQLDIKLNYNSDSNNGQGDLSFKWNPLKEIIVNFNIIKKNNRFKQGTILLRSPFENYENIKLNAIYDTDGKYSAIGKLEWAPDKKIEIGAHHSNDRDRNLEVSVSFKSPFENFKDLNLDAQYENLDNKYFLKGEFKWASNKSIEVRGDFRNDHNRNIKTSGSFKSPFHDFKNLDFNTEFDNKDDKYSVKGKFGWAPEKRIEIEGNHRNDGFMNSETYALLKSPFEDFKNVEFNTQFENDDNRYLIKGGFDWAQDKKVEIKANHKSDDVGNFETSASFKSPFENFENLDLETQFENIDNKYSLRGGFGWAEDKRVEIKGNHRNDEMKNLETSVSLSSPFENFEKLEFDAKYDSNDKLSSSGKFEWGPDKKIEFRGDYRYDDPKNFVSSLSLDSKYFNIKDWRGQIKVDDDNNNYKAKAEYSYDSNKVLIQIDHKYEENPCTYEGSIIVQTSYEDLKSAKVEYAHKHKKRDSTLDQILVEVNDQEKVNLEVIIDNKNKNYRSGRIVFKNPFQPVSGSYEYLSKTSSSNSQDKLMGEICMDISKCNEKNLKFEINREKGYKLLKINIELKRPSNRRVRYDMLLDWNNKYNADVRLEYPERTMLLSVHHEHNDRKIVSLAELKWDSARNEKKRIGYRLNHQDLSRDSSDFKTDLVIWLPRKDLVLRAKYLSDDRVIANLQLECEFLNNPGKIFTLLARLSNEQPNSVSSMNYSLILDYMSHDKMNVRLQSHIARSPERLSSRLYLIDVSPNQKKRNLELWTELNRKDKTMIALMRVPGKSIEASGNYEHISSIDGDLFKLNLQTNVDGKKEGNAELLYDKRKKLMDAKVFYDLDKNKMLHVYGQLVNNTFAKFEAYRKMGDEKMNDLEGAISLNRANLMSSHVYWRRDSASDLKEQVQKMDDLRSQSYDRLSEYSSDGYYEIMDRFDLAFRRTKDNFRLSFDEMNNDASKIVEELKQHYNNGKKNLDDFYSESLADLMKKSKRLNDFMDSSRDMYNDYKERIRNSYNEYSERMRKFYEDYMPSEYFAKFADKIKDKVSDIYKSSCDLSKDMKKEVDEYLSKVRDYQYWYAIKDYYNDVDDWIRESYDKYVSKNPWVCKLADLKQQVANRLRDAKRKISEVLEPGINRMSRVVDKVVDKYEELKFNVRSRLEEAQKQLANRDDFKYIKDKYREVAEIFPMREYMRKSYDALYDSAAYFAKDYYKDNYKSEMSLDVDAGKFKMTNPLPLEWKSLESLPDPSRLFKYADLMKEKYDQLKSYSIWDTFYQYKPSSDLANWIPPFKAIAMISEQHIKTFDGRFYDFAGECNYLLASDFVDKNFTMLANYARQGVLKSVLIEIEQNEMIIFSEGKVKVNGRLVELPHFIDGISIKRISTKILIKSDRGIMLIFLPEYKLFSLEMAGWYFGKTGGLFGTYDNEANNDFMKHDRTLANNVVDFVNSWNVDDTCHSKYNFAKTRKAEPESRAYKKCQELFEKQSSPLRSAFSLEDPKPYLDMCSKDALSIQNSVDEDISYCNAAIMYVEQARKKHSVPLNPPKPCVKCVHPEGKDLIEAGSYKVDGNAPKSADVVYVVEQKSCNNEFSKKIDELSKRIEAYFSKEQLNNNRYSVIGFGGQSDPLIHTVDGEIFSNDRLISKAVNNFVYEDKKSHSNAFEAMRVAADLPFRTGVAKKVILVMCSDCEEKEMSITYGDIQRIYLEHDIDLHILKKSILGVKGKPALSDSIYGISAISVFTKKDDKSSSIGDKDLRKQVSVPKDICVALAQETNGTMFSSEKLFAGSASDSKIFLNVFAKAITQGTQPAECQICDCVMVDGYSGKTVCRICDVPKPVLIQKSAFGSLNENVDKVEKKEDEEQKPKSANKKVQKKPNKKMMKSAFRHDEDQFYDFFADDFDWIE